MTKYFLSLLLFATVSPAFASIADDLAQLQGKSALEQFHERLIGNWSDGESFMTYSREQDGDFHINGELISTDEDGTKYNGFPVIVVTPNDFETRMDYPDGSYWISRAEFLDDDTFVVSGEYYAKNEAGEYVLTETARRSVFKRQP